MSDFHWRLIKWGSLAVSVGSLLVAVLLMWLNQKEAVVETAVEDPGAAGQPQTKVERPLIVERKGDRMIWKLQAESAKQQEQGMHLIKPYLELYTEEGKAVPVSGDEAWFEPDRRNIRFSGKVEVIHEEWTLQTDELSYVSGKDEMVAPGKFRLFQPDVLLRGRGLRVDRKGERLYVDHDVWLEDARPDGFGSIK